MENNTTKKNRDGALSVIFDTVELFVLAVAIVILLFTFGARLCKVNGDSMMQTLTHGEMLVVSDLAYSPTEGDIVVFHQTHATSSRLNEPIVKRIIATEGKHVYIDYQTAKVYVSDDEVFDESDVIEEDYDYIDNSQGVITDPYYSRGRTYVVPKGCVFVLGDNRNNSLDSRSYDIGMVDERRILGRVIFGFKVPSVFAR